jgi:peptidoglycan/LPS O-acetylase OafA/YrhL
MVRIYSEDFNVFWYSSLLTSQCVGTLLLIPYLNDLKTGKGILFKFITFTSTISYSMYLLNFTPFSILTKSLPDGYIKVTGCIVFTYLGAYMMYKCIEKPFMNLRDRKPYHGLHKIDEREEYISIEGELR